MANNGSKSLLNEWTVGSAGLAGALAAASQAARRANEVRVWQQTEDRIAAKHDLLATKRARVDALHRKLALTKQLADLKTGNRG